MPLPAAKSAPRMTRIDPVAGAQIPNLQQTAIAERRNPFAVEAPCPGQRRTDFPRARKFAPPVQVPVGQTLAGLQRFCAHRGHELVLAIDEGISHAASPPKLR